MGSAGESQSLLRRFLHQTTPPERELETGTASEAEVDNQAETEEEEEEQEEGTSGTDEDESDCQDYYDDMDEDWRVAG